MKALLLATLLLCCAASFSQALTQAKPNKKIEDKFLWSGIYEGDYTANNTKLIGYRIDPNKVDLGVPIPDTSKNDYLYLSINNNMTLIPVSVSNTQTKTNVYGYGNIKYKLVVDNKAPTQSGVGLGATLYTIVRGKTVAERRVCFL